MKKNYFPKNATKTSTPLVLNCEKKSLKNTLTGLFLFLFTFLGFSYAFGQTTEPITTTGAGTWIVPCGVTSITVEAWGAGGAGGGCTSNNDSGDGGGSGAYTSGIFAVTAGSNIAYTIGTGGVGSTINGTDGGDTTILGMIAGGGQGGDSNGGTVTGIGGTASGGTINTNGNNGTAGGTGTGGDGGDAPAGGGIGGTGNPNANGGNGNAPGGGGGGGERFAIIFDRAGGDGGNGQITITYNVSLPANPGNPTSNSPQCNPPGVTLTRTGTPPAGETWYWQTTASGISTANSGATFVATTGGTYYLRAQNNTTGCWSAGSGSTTVTVNGAKTWNGSVSTDWNVANNWTPVGVPTSADCVVIPNTANDPIISGASYDALGLNLTIENGAVLTVNATNDIIINDWVNINAGGDLQLNNSASLIQVNNNPNTGTMHMNRTVNMRRLDYVYWSSPVTSFASSAISPGTPTSYIYKWTPTIGTNINGFGNWALGNENMVVGKGYIVRGPNAFTTTPAPFTATFTGTPNNGVITTPILRGNWNGGTYSTGVSTTLGTNYDDNWNLIGNPYPSAVNAISFLTANTNIDGFIKIWTHGTLPSTAIADPFYSDYVYNYTPGDYITYNSSGTSSGPGVFNGNIASGQGFFVSMLHTTGSTSENITFNNSMRNTLNSNSQFFRSSTNRNSENDGRIWLDLIDSNLNSVRNLIGYIDGATNSRDRLFDAITDEKLNLNLYSKIGTEPMTIQGRTLPFDEYDLVPMGIKVPQDGNYSIGIGAVDGFFTNTSQNIFLEDLDTNIIHDLRQNPYSFTAVAGDDSDRFILRFTNNTLGNEDITNEEVNVWAITSDNLSIKSTKSTIQSVRVFDILGRLLADYQNVNGYEIPLTKIQKNNAALIVQVTLTNGAIVNKKIIY